MTRRNDMDYEKLWKVYRKHIQACKKRVYSSQEVLNLGFRLEEEARRADIKQAYNNARKAAGK